MWEVQALTWCKALCVFSLSLPGCLLHAINLTRLHAWPGLAWRGCMQGVLRAVVPWTDARRFLALRLRRRLAEEQMAHHITATGERAVRCGLYLRR